MRIYNNCYEAIREIERNVYELGVTVRPESMQDIDTRGNDDFITKELMAETYCIISGHDKDSMLEYMKLPVDYAVQEFKDRINSNQYRLNPGNSYLLREDVWSKFLHDGKFSYTYNERFHYRYQLDTIIQELKTRPNTRQAIIQIWDQDHDLSELGGNSRVPCSLMYQFIIREGALHIHYFQRSGDFLTHLPYDIWFALAMKDYVAAILGIPSGRMYHYVTSLHAYNKDLKTRGIF